MAFRQFSRSSPKLQELPLSPNTAHRHKGPPPEKAEITALHSASQLVERDHEQQVQQERTTEHQPKQDLHRSRDQQTISRPQLRQDLLHGQPPHLSHPPSKRDGGPSSVVSSPPFVHNGPAFVYSGPTYGQPILNQDGNAHSSVVTGQRWSSPGTNPTLRISQPPESPMSELSSIPVGGAQRQGFQLPLQMMHQAQIMHHGMGLLHSPQNGGHQQPHSVGMMMSPFVQTQHPGNLVYVQSPFLYNADPNGAAAVSAPRSDGVPAVPYPILQALRPPPSHASTSVANPDRMREGESSSSSGARHSPLDLPLPERTNAETALPWQNGIPRFTCDVCHKTMNSQSSLTRHRRLHGPAPVYTCEVCGKQVRRKDNFATHMRIHSGERPFSCDTCGRHFRQRSSLCNHRRIHTDEMPYACEQCNKRFKWKGSYTRHVASMHPEVDLSETATDQTSVAGGIDAQLAAAAAAVLQEEKAADLPVDDVEMS